MEVQQTLAGFANIFASYRSEFGWEPSPGSLAAEATRREAEVAGAWSDEPVADLLALVSLQMTSAAEHLEGVARVLEDEPMVFVPASVARGAVEAAGRSWWLLDPNLTLDQRVHRALTERLYGIWENSKYPERVRGREVWERKIARILGEAARREVPFATGTDRRAPYVGAERRPPSTRLTQELFGSKEIGAVVYRHLSAIAHATTSLARGVDPDLEEHEVTPAGAHLVVNADSVILLGLGASWAFSSAFNRLIVFYGWDATSWLSWRQFRLSKLWRMLEAVPRTGRRIPDPDEFAPPGTGNSL